MTFIVKSTNTLFLFVFLFLTASCSGQTKPVASSDTSNVVAETRISLPEGVSSQTMFRSSFKDKEGNLWFGTTGAGVYKYDGKWFTRYAETEGLTNTTVYSITQDLRGQIWVGTENGVFSLKINEFVRLEIPNFNSINGKQQVYCILADKKGNLWFGTDNQGLWYYNNSSFTNFRCAENTWVKVPEKSSEGYKQNGFVESLLEDKNGMIWLSSSAACLEFYDGNTFHKVEVDNSRGHVFKMIEDKSGDIWMATRLGGVCRYNGNKIDCLTEKDGIADNSASSLVEGKDGTIWFGSLGIAGSRGNGLKGITKYDGKIVTAIPSTGLRNNQVWTIAEDNSGNIWVGTKEFGLYRYDGEMFTEFTTR